MPDLFVLFLAASATAFATGVGAIPVWLLGTRTAAMMVLDLALGV